MEKKWSMKWRLLYVGGIEGLYELESKLLKGLYRGLYRGLL